MRLPAAFAFGENEHGTIWRPCYMLGSATAGVLVELTDWEGHTDCGDVVVRVCVVSLQGWAEECAEWNRVRLLLARMDMELQAIESRVRAMVNTYATRQVTGVRNINGKIEIFDGYWHGVRV